MRGLRMRSLRNKLQNKHKRDLCYYESGSVDTIYLALRSCLAFSYFSDMGQIICYQYHRQRLLMLRNVD